MAERQVTFKDAVLEALAEEMRADPSVVLIGEDIGAAGGVFLQTKGLFEEFGASRVIDTPISESAIVGMAIGAAMTGLRPVVEIMFGDFITLGMDQLVNQAAKVRYMSAGGFTVPLVLRTAIGVGGNLGPQHSQSLHAWVAHVPGLKVVMPSNAADAKGLMKAAIRDGDPVVFFESRSSYNTKGPVSDGEHVVPIGKAAVTREGRNVSIVAVGAMVGVALQVAERLAGEDISVEVVDVRSLVPLDEGTILKSVKKTSRALVLDAGYAQFGVTGEIAALIAEQAFDWLDAPVMRLAAPNVPIPFSRTLEPLVIPSRDQAAAKVRELMGTR
ncbi:MAG: alpha-ketoacid dehydrogenase subunit beta [Rhizobiales bacterium]|nr:alpha-ketoacid dehydrogenase subunit beta [Hyphomicrobiales bacterium]